MKASFHRYGPSDEIRSAPPTSSHAARQAFGANVATSMSRRSGMWIDDSAQVDGSCSS